MIKRVVHTALPAALLGLVLLGSASCDSLNPAFVQQLGGDVNSAGLEPNGSVLVVFNNRTAFPAALQTQVELERAGETSRTAIQTLALPSLSNFIVSLDCDTVAITLSSITVTATTTTPTGTGTGTGTGTTTSTQTVALATPEFRRPTLTCGSVVFVNLQQSGTTFSASAEMYK